MVTVCVYKVGLHDRLRITPTTAVSTARMARYTTLTQIAFLFVCLAADGIAVVAKLHRFCL